MPEDYTSNTSPYTQYFESIAATVINENGTLSEFHNDDHTNQLEIPNNDHTNQLEIPNNDRDDQPRAINFASNDYNLPKAIDTCKFCNKTFLYPGSLGRHLDRKKGTPGHPTEAIDAIRRNVRRVGDLEMSKVRARERQRRYRTKEHVKEKLKEQRKIRYRLNKTGRETVSSPFDFNVSYPAFILKNLEPAKWPELLPTEETFQELAARMMSDEEVSKLTAIHEEWRALTEIEKYQQYLNLTQKLLKTKYNSPK